MIAVISSRHTTNEVSMASKTFPLDSAFGSEAGGNLELSGTTSTDVALAVAGKQPMPTRPGGVLELGSIGLSVASGTGLRFTAGAAKADVSFAAGVAAGLGILTRQVRRSRRSRWARPGADHCPRRLEEDTLRAAPRELFSIRKREGHASHWCGRCLHLRLIGVGPGCDGCSPAFDADKPADAVLRDVVTAWKLPRHVGSADDLPPRSWVVAEANGSIAVTLGAKVGYDFSFLREVKAAGLSGDVDLIDAAAKASLASMSVGAISSSSAASRTQRGCVCGCSSCHGEASTSASI